MKESNNLANIAQYKATTKENIDNHNKTVHKRIKGITNIQRLCK